MRPSFLALTVLVVGALLSGCASWGRATYTAWTAGDPADAPATGPGAGLVLMGGAADVDAAFAWAAERAGGGDAVILRASGGAGYQDYLYRRVGGFDSVETLLVPTRAAARTSHVVDRVRRAEFVFLAGGQQSRYLRHWRGTPLADAVQEVWDRGGVVGGTSAGLAVLGELAFPGHRGTISSREARRDPDDPRISVEPGLIDVGLLRGVLTDTHFAERDRVVRLRVFLDHVVRHGLHDDPVGLGIDEGTALVVEDDGFGSVIGRGSVHVVPREGDVRTYDAGATVVLPLR